MVVPVVLLVVVPLVKHPLMVLPLASPTFRVPTVLMLVPLHPLIPFEPSRPNTPMT